MPKFIISEQLFRYPIEILDVPRRAMVRLRAKGIVWLQDLALLSDDDLLAIYHFGRKSLFELQKRLEALNECACRQGALPEELLECMRLKLQNSEELIGKMVQAVIGEVSTRNSIAYVLSKMPPRAVFVVAERIGLRKGQIRTLQELADMMSLTRERVRQLQNRTFEHLRQKLEAEKLLEEWEDVLTWAALEPPSGEGNFLDRVARTGIPCQATATGFVVLATHLIKDVDLPVLLRASRDGKLSRFWAKRRQREPSEV